MMLPLVHAALRGEDVMPALDALTRRFGFDTFLYATASYHVRPDNDERMYIFTTAPLAWVMRYDQRGYVECDPRVLRSFESSLPFVWDHVTERGHNARTDAFLDDASAHGVASGVAFPVYATRPSRTLVALSSPAPMIDKVRREQIIRDLGDIVLFGQYFHELFVKGVIEKGLAPSSEGAPLSQRERECLELAARGLSSSEIGIKLGVAARTVDFHVSNLISKLGVRNRRQAIAEGARLGLYFGDRWESSRVARSSGDAAQDPSIPNPVSETGGRAARARTSSA
jgi:DNA-binding CsgD family transcriptional regulator